MVRLLGILLRLARPAVLLFSVVGVFVGVVLSNGSALLPAPLVLAAAMGALSVLAIVAGGCALGSASWNAAHGPDDPGPAARIPDRMANGVWFLMTVAGLGLSVLLSWQHFVLAAVAMFLVYLVAARLRRRPLARALVTAVLAAGVLVYGGLVGDEPRNALVGAVFVALTILALRMLKEKAPDRSDHTEDAPPHAPRYAIASTAPWPAAVLLTVVLLSPFPFVAMGYGPLYLLGMLLADILLLRSIWLETIPVSGPSSAASWLRSGIAFGLVALLLA